jgi:hypothetical protein
VRTSVEHSNRPGRTRACNQAIMSPELAARYRNKDEIHRDVDATRWHQSPFSACS